MKELKLNLVVFPSETIDDLGYFELFLVNSKTGIRRLIQEALEAFFCLNQGRGA